jgi:hypothetical protein
MDKASTGIRGFDEAIDRLRLGDNVVWQADSVEDYRIMAQAFAERARLDGRRLVYVRFGIHEPLLGEGPCTAVCSIDPGEGFESFAADVHNLVKREGRKVFYVFDCLTDLLKYWHSDLMIGNFFKVTCPFLYELDTVAYFSIMRSEHTYGTIARIRETTQLLLDLYRVNGKYYIHPLKVWQRYSPTMFFPHLIQGQEAVCITASSEVAELFSSIHRGGDRPDYWDAAFARARDSLAEPGGCHEETKRLLMRMLIGGESRMFGLCDRYFTLSDILAIASREVGSGFIGGKSVGMLVARKILECDGGERFERYMERHDSYYLGSDVFYTYIVENGCWRLRIEQKTLEGFYRNAPELKEKLLRGSFPKNIREQFIQMLGYFGQSPIIVRSSSLLEDNFGNAFTGKYESVFCANQGSVEERCEAFEQAVRTVYASTMDEDALAYRMNRGLFDRDEQMAILVQRVSGDQYGDLYFPHVAGVGNSSNLYVWDKSIDMEAGMLRLVFGLGTRAVDRAVGDYARVVSLDNPLRLPPMDLEDRRKYSQHCADVLSIRENALTCKNLEEVLALDIRADAELFASEDYRAAERLRELGRAGANPPRMLDFEKLLGKTDFPAVMKDMLALLSRVYDYPVDIEFTANFSRDNRFKVNLLQCRPLQTRGLGKPVAMPKVSGGADCFICQKGNFMGGNVRLPVEYVVYVQPRAYTELGEQDKYAAARTIGLLNRELKGKSVLLAGPGRWGTTTPSLGVPVHFSEIGNMAAVCEVASPEEGFMPELSYGSHFFQDLVETGIFYAAVFAGQKDVRFHPERILERENLLSALLPDGARLSGAIHVARTEGMELFSDIVSQTLVCR